MEVRRAAEVLLRSNNATTNLAAAISTTSRHQQCQLTPQTTSTPSTRRTFSNGSRDFAQRSQATTSSEKPPPRRLSLLNGFNFAKAGFPKDSDSSLKGMSKDLWGGPRHSPATSAGGSAADMLKSLSHSNTTLNLSRMRDPSPGSAVRSAEERELTESMNMSVNEMTSLSNGLGMPSGYTRPAMRLRPSTGRLVSLTPVMDVASAFKKLDIMCARNKVRSDSNRQRFHERPGLKRKRLASERWRKRFGAGFKATVARVKQLRKQGW